MKLIKINMMNLFAADIIIKENISLKEAEKLKGELDYEQGDYADFYVQYKIVEDDYIPLVGQSNKDHERELQRLFPKYKVHNQIEEEYSKPEKNYVIALSYFGIFVALLTITFAIFVIVKL